MAAIQAAIAVATGGSWLEQFRAQQGHVLLALGEEDLDEARRRLWRACNALDLSREERQAIADRIDLLPMAGVPVALTSLIGPGVVDATPLAGDLRARLEAREVDWALVVIDPLSRWAGGGVEANNEIATRFIQLMESYTTVRGNPTVLVAHHSSKTSTKEGASDARGVTAIRDGFRWMISLDGVTADDGTHAVKLSNGKSNYSMKFEPIILMRSEAPGCEGTLRIATEAEAEPFTRGEPERRAQAREEREATIKGQALSDALNVARILKQQPGIGVRELRGAMRARCAAGSARVDTALATLGPAVTKTDGARGAKPMMLDESQLPREVREGFECA
jgi:RecA-family ATPase